MPLSRPCSFGNLVTITNHAADNQPLNNDNILDQQADTAIVNPPAVVTPPPTVVVPPPAVATASPAVVTPPSSITEAATMELFGVDLVRSEVQQSLQQPNITAATSLFTQTEGQTLVGQRELSIAKRSIDLSHNQLFLNVGALARVIKSS